MTPDSDEQMQEGRVPVILAVDDDHEVASALERQPYLLETSVPGVFAAGDVRYLSFKRVASPVGEGSTAIALIHQYLREGPNRRGRTLAG